MWMGTSIAPRRTMPNHASTNSGTLPIMIATRSPRCTPQERSSPAKRRLRSSSWPVVTAPRAKRRNGRSRSASAARSTLLPSVWGKSTSRTSDHLLDDGVLRRPHRLGGPVDHQLDLVQDPVALAGDLGLDQRAGGRAQEQPEDEPLVDEPRRVLGGRMRLGDAQFEQRAGLLVVVLHPAQRRARGTADDDAAAVLGDAEQQASGDLAQRALQRRAVVGAAGTRGAQPPGQQLLAPA